MMQRYYFNLSDGRRWYPDPTGVELDGPDAARQHALHDARSLLESWMARSALPWRLVVHDSVGTVVCSLNLAELATLDGQSLLPDGVERTRPIEPPRLRTSRIIKPQRSPTTKAHTARSGYGPLCVVSGVIELQHETHNDR
jgi:hypothetical protein